MASFSPKLAQIRLFRTKITACPFWMGITLVTLHEKSRERKKKIAGLSDREVPPSFNTSEKKNYPTRTSQLCRSSLWPRWMACSSLKNVVAISPGLPELMLITLSL